MINQLQGGHPIALVSMVTTLGEKSLNAVLPTHTQTKTFRFTKNPGSYGRPLKKALLPARYFRALLALLQTGTAERLLKTRKHEISRAIACCEKPFSAQVLCIK